ncbi:MAG: SurA N-terminal domain-containing protein [Humidesulfovibrio sp.]|uniref:SurA N-terminal domain-containing protein n=1 Tax=Humidesulfovibrio sp. TaxID=2910988 RepID=UPI00273513DB|nr:SurA N-terminal domain-containing protein [Humidesulfovibrio sp.]MDP2848745.1 SurA N-terminal domain-containing protein [Humidesulfovibrio sp.]
MALALVMLSALLWRSPALAEDLVVDGVIALVNGKIVTKFDHDIRMRPVYEQARGRQLTTEEISQIATLRRKILDQMIDELLIQEDAERYKLKVTDAEVEDQVKDFLAKRQLTEAEFKTQLALQRMSRQDFVRNMRRDMIKHRLIGGVITSKVVVTDTEVEQRYNERKAEFSKDSMVQLSLILVPASMSATDLKSQIESGQLSFADAANKYSQGPGVGHGGDIGFIAWKDLAPEWNNALAGLKPGQISQPVHVQDFSGLLQVVSLKEGEELPLDAVREQIYQSLHEVKFEAVFQEYMLKLREKAVIEYRNL